MPNKFELGVLVLVTVFLCLIAVGFRSHAASNLAQSQLPINPDSLTGEYNPNDTRAEFHGKQMLSSETPHLRLTKQVLGTSDPDKPKRIEVDLTTQRLYAYEGDEKIYDFLISSGKWGRTPTGTFTIWGKFRYTKMEGGSKANNTYYYLANVPYVMYFGNDEIAPSRGFGIHGTYWHDNFGHPMSHGCINMKTEEAALLFNWAQPDLGEAKSGRATEENPGTQVIIYGTAPRE